MKMRKEYFKTELATDNACKNCGKNCNFNGRTVDKSRNDKKNKYGCNSSLVGEGQVVICPICQSKNIEKQLDSDWEEDCYWYKCTCKDCKAYWEIDVM